MGLDHTVHFPTGLTPEWSAIRAQLGRVGESGQLRMIDNLPAFPDEDPPADWREIRVGTAGGMVTIRRGVGELTCVIWGNADPALSAAWGKVLWACAAAGDGEVACEETRLSATAFASGHGISPE